MGAGHAPHLGRNGRHESPCPAIARGGLYPAIITPMTADDQINEDAFRQVMEFNIQAGVHGFWVAGGTGESVMLDDAENMRLAEIAADQSQGRIKNIMHVGAPTTKRAAKMAEHAAKVGVEAICCVPPFFYGRSHEDIVEHYRIVAAAADLPFFAYNLPSSTNVEITPDLMKKMQDAVPQLAGLKHSALNFSYVRNFTKMGLACFIGNCRLMLPALMAGAVGCIDGPPNMVPEPWVALWNAYQAGDLEGAKVAQDHGTEVANIVQPASFHAIFKTVISDRLGIDCGVPRPPAQPLSPEVRQKILDTIAALGVKKVAMA
ncbi:MAG: dihydrodipicolinate synthase family protein [Chloroflexota bacterium]